MLKAFQLFVSMEECHPPFLPSDPHPNLSPVRPPRLNAPTNLSISPISLVVWLSESPMAFMCRQRNGVPQLRQPMSMYWHFGGACAMFSAGLFDAIPAEPWLDCGRKTVCGGGDKRTASCVWNLAHVAITDVSWAGLSQGQFGKAHAAIKKFMSFHRITPTMASKLYSAELSAHMRVRVNSSTPRDV